MEGKFLNTVHKERSERLPQAVTIIHKYDKYSFIDEYYKLDQINERISKPQK